VRATFAGNMKRTFTIRQAAAPTALQKVDKRNGDAWCLSLALLPENKDKSRPRYMGNLGLDGANPQAREDAILLMRRR
jgi:hypothetical protein